MLKAESAPTCFLDTKLIIFSLTPSPQPPRKENPIIQDSHTPPPPYYHRTVVTAGILMLGVLAQVTLERYILEKYSLINHYFYNYTLAAD